MCERVRLVCLCAQAQSIVEWPLAISQAPQSQHAFQHLMSGNHTVSHTHTHTLYSTCPSPSMNDTLSRIHTEYTKELQSHTCHAICKHFHVTQTSESHMFHHVITVSLSKVHNTHLMSSDGRRSCK